MKTTKEYVLAVNGGSSSIKFAIYETDEPPKKWLNGRIDRI